MYLPLAPRGIIHCRTCLDGPSGGEVVPAFQSSVGVVMSRSRTVVSFALVMVMLVFSTRASAQTWDRKRIQTAVDSIVGSLLTGNRAAGMSVAVVHGRDTLVMKGYGFADLEFDVPTPQRGVAVIGSVTEQ